MSSDPRPAERGSFFAWLMRLLRCCFCQPLTHHAMKKGAVPLGEVAARATHLDVACTRCERRGRYRLSKLVESLGAEFPMTDLAAEITSCPRRNATAAHERCDVFFPGLPQIMNGDQPARSRPDDPDDD